MAYTQTALFNTCLHGEIAIPQLDVVVVVVVVWYSTLVSSRLTSTFFGNFNSNWINH